MPSKSRPSKGSGIRQELAGRPDLHVVPEEQAPDTSTSTIPDVGALAQMTGYALRRAQIAVFEDFNHTLAETGLRPAQFSVLLMLHQTPGLTQSAVAAALGIQRANFVTLINDLERAGLAERAASLTDKRSHALHLTPKGQATLTRALELQSVHEARVQAAVGQNNVGTLLEVLMRLGRGLKL